MKTLLVLAGVAALTGCASTAYQNQAASQPANPQPRYEHQLVQDDGEGWTYFLELVEVRDP